LETISGFDSHDGTSSKERVPNFYSETKTFRDTQKIKGLRIGVPKQYFEGNLNSEVRKKTEETLSLFKDQGAVLVDIELPHTKYALPVYYLVCTSECSSNLARYDGIHYGYRSPNAVDGDLLDIYSRSRGEGFGAEVRLRILMGTYALSSGYYDAFFRKASQVRALIKKDFTEAFAKCDVIAGPTSPFTAFKIGERFGDPLAMYLADVYTLSTNLAALPGLSFNSGFDNNGLPIGFQLQAPWWQETRLLGMAALFQKLKPETVRKAVGVNP
jgi:aspartyl-tRNA(Asn)/glutamyl-tRNA(Gln) amidotransferase subunit A